MVKVSEIKKTKWYQWLGNKYVIFILLFLTWMFFFDDNNYFFHKELSDDIKALEESKEFYKKEIKKDRTFIDKMKDSSEMERFAREKYYLKKENEDIYIIEHQDSIE
ncbi:septum formation initiator family protein [Flavobacteriaceae bacterium]|nr:septum formation initiator family protein [Flavobacteriaceae bacterium]